MRILPRKEGDLDLLGVTLFEQSQQTGIERRTFGYCLEIENQKEQRKGAVIGLSKELLMHEPDEFIYFVVFHELAHLTDMKHNDVFSSRFTGFMYNWYNHNKIANM